MESIWTANKTHWREQALCGGAAPDQFTPAVETPEGLVKVRDRYCAHCPVIEACLNSAIIHNDAGYWGGTTSAQRRAMRRTRSRSKCPLCTSPNLVRVPHADPEIPYEVCLNCAASWKADERPTPRQKKAEATLHRAPVAVVPVPVVPVKKSAKRRTTTTAVRTVPLTEESASCL